MVGAKRRPSLIPSTTISCRCLVNLFLQIFVFTNLLNRSQWDKPYFCDKYMKFLVAIDGSQASDHALEKAISFATPLKAEIVLLSVVEPLSSYVPEVMLPTGDWVGWRGLPDVELERKILNAGQALLNKAQDVCAIAQVASRTRLETGQPRDVICLVCKDESPDLLIVGSRGLGSVERLMLGSVSDYVVHHCASPVLVVR